MFWLLVCVAYKVLRRYYDASLILNDRIKNGNRPFLNNSVYGLKEDLILLKLSLKEFLPKVHYKFLEVGISLEFYFGDCFLNMYSNFLSNEIMFRVWDILFFEAREEEKVYNTFYNYF